MVDCACMVGSLHVLFLLQRGGACLNHGIENVFFFFFFFFFFLSLFLSLLFFFSCLIF